MISKAFPVFEPCPILFCHAKTKTAPPTWYEWSKSAASENCYEKSRKPLKTKAFGIVSWRRKRDLNPRPHA